MFVGYRAQSDAMQTQQSQQRRGERDVWASELLDSHSSMLEERSELQALCSQLHAQYSQSESRLYRLQVEQELERNRLQDEISSSVNEQVAVAVNEQVALMEEKLKAATGEIANLMSENKQLSFKIKKVETAQYVQGERSASPQGERSVSPGDSPSEEPEHKGRWMRSATPATASPELGSPGPSHCSSCGNKFADDAEFCRKCGKARGSTRSKSAPPKSNWGTLKNAVGTVGDFRRVHTHTQGGYRISPSPDVGQPRLDANQPHKKKYVRIGGKVVDPDKVQAAIEQAHKKAHKTADKVRSGKNSPVRSSASMIDTEHGSFARISGVAANAALAFDKAEELVTRKNRMSKSTFFLPADLAAKTPEEEAKWNNCHSKLKLVHVHG